MKKEKVLTPLQAATEAFFEAAAEVRRKRNALNIVSPEFFEIANQEYTIAMEHLDVLSKKLKKL